MARPLAAQLDHPLDRVRLALEDGLDGPVGPVGRPARDAALLRGPPHRIAEEHALHAPVGAHPLPSSHGGYRRPMAAPRAQSDLAAALADAGGTAAPAAATAQLRGLLLDALRHGRSELARARSGRGRPVEVAIAVRGGRLLAATPAAAALRADPEQVSERAWLLVAAVVGALVDLAEPGPPVDAGALAIRAGDLDGFLVVVLPAPGLEPGALDELAPLAFEDHAAGIDRLVAVARAVPGALLADVAGREPIGEWHPLWIAEAVARLGGRPADARSVEEFEDAVVALLEPDGERAARPHEDPDPARRVARRILQRLDGMGKWGGYHTDFAHLARGFAGNDRRLAQAVGEALIAGGLLDEKPSVGQRHVFLNPRRAADIHRLIHDGAVPPGLSLP